MVTIVNLALPMETTSLKGLTVETLVWPRNGVGLTIVDAICLKSLCCRE